MKTSFLRDQIVLKKSFLCLGLDSDLDKIPKHLLNESDPIFTFNKILLDSLNKLIVAVKINTAFYEAYGHKGWKTLERTIKYIKIIVQPSSTYKISCICFLSIQVSIG